MKDTPLNFIRKMAPSMKKVYIIIFPTGAIFFRRVPKKTLRSLHEAKPQTLDKLMPNNPLSIGRCCGLPWRRPRMSSFASPKVWEEPTEVTHEGANALGLRNCWFQENSAGFSNGFSAENLPIHVFKFANSGCRTSRRKPSRCCQWSGKTALGGIQLIK